MPSDIRLDNSVVFAARLGAFDSVKKVNERICFDFKRSEPEHVKEFLMTRLFSF